MIQWREQGGLKMMISFVDYIIPDSPNDFGAILLWILITILVLLILRDIRTYVSYRKKSHATTRPQQTQKIGQPMNSSDTERVQEFVEIRSKVDKLIEAHNL